MIVVFNLSRRSKVCTRIPPAFTGATFSMTHLQYYFFFFPPLSPLPELMTTTPKKAAFKTATRPPKVHSGAEKVMLRFQAKLARSAARKRTTTSPPPTSSPLPLLAIPQRSHTPVPDAQNKRGGLTFWEERR